MMTRALNNVRDEVTFSLFDAVTRTESDEREPTRESCANEPAREAGRGTDVASEAQPVIDCAADGMPPDGSDMESPSMRPS